MYTLGVTTRIHGLMVTKMARGYAWLRWYPWIRVVTVVSIDTTPTHAYPWCHKPSMDNTSNHDVSMDNTCNHCVSMAQQYNHGVSMDQIPIHGVSTAAWIQKSVDTHGYKCIHGYIRYPRTCMVRNISTVYPRHDGYKNSVDTHGYKNIHGHSPYPWIPHVTIAHPWINYITMSHPWTKPLSTAYPQLRGYKFIMDTHG